MKRRAASGRNTAKALRRKRSKLRRAPTAKRGATPSAADLQAQVRALTRQLTESQEQQTATSEVLKVISSSPGELEPVFQAMLENATRICDAKFGTVFRFDGEKFYMAAGVNTPPKMVEFQKRRGGFLPPPGSAFHRMVQNRQVSLTAERRRK